MRITVLLSALALAAVAACGADDEPAPESSPAVSAPVDQTAETVACADLIADVLTVEAARTGTCTLPGGTVLAGWAVECADGTYLAQLDFPAEQQSWAVTGQRWRTVASVADDPSYGRAFDAC